MGIFDSSGSWKDGPNKRFSTKVDESRNFDFVARINEDNSVPKDVINDLKAYLKRYKPDKNIHYHIYEGSLFFGATTESGTFTCAYCEAGKMPLHTIMIDGIRVQHYRQVIGEGMSHGEKVGKIVYIQ